MPCRFVLRRLAARRRCVAALPQGKKFPMSDRAKTFAVVMPSMLSGEWSRCSYETERAVAALMEGAPAMEVPSRFGPTRLYRLPEARAALEAVPARTILVRRFVSIGLYADRALRLAEVSFSQPEDVPVPYAMRLVAREPEGVPEKERSRRLLVPAILFAGRLDLPVREVAEWLGFLVDELDVVRTAFGGSGQEPDPDRMYVCFH